MNDDEGDLVQPKLADLWMAMTGAAYVVWPWVRKPPRRHVLGVGSTLLGLL